MSSLLSDAQMADAGGAVSDLFGAVGDFASASAYSEASKLNASNARIALASGNINAALQERNTYQAGSTVRASTAATGFTFGGSAGDILREQAQQGALAKSLVLSQAELTSQSYAAQSAAEQGQANASKAGGVGGLLGGAIKIAGFFGL